jgi:hypothetical protein
MKYLLPIEDVQTEQKTEEGTKVGQKASKSAFRNERRKKDQELTILVFPIRGFDYIVVNSLFIGRSSLSYVPVQFS